MKFSELILNWYDKNKRNLPWRLTKDPYKIWISEIILQQTRIAQGTSYYNRFINRFPTLKSLAKSDENDVLLMWQGLGYYSRARNLLFSAKHIYNNLGSKFPETYNEIIKLKGVGDYTASAIASICFEEQTPVLDGNVYRVLSRIYELENPINLSSSRKIFKEKAKTLMSTKRCGDYNQALMDFGSLVCKPQNPLCDSCNVSKLCKSFNNNSVLKYPVKTSKNKIKTLFYDYIILKKDTKTLIVKIEDGIWKNLYQFPVCISEKKQSKEYLEEYFKKIYNASEVKISLINQKFINHKLSHLILKSRFWNIYIENNMEKGLFVSDLKDFPIPQLMRNFTEKYKTKLSII